MSAKKQSAAKGGKKGQAKKPTEFNWAELKPKFIYVKLGDLNPYKNNPRINKESIPLVRNSIKTFGFLVPMVIDNEDDLCIVAGHTRHRAAMMLCEEEMRDPAEVEVPCILAEHLTKNQIAAFRIADNSVGEGSTWDEGKLAMEIASIGDDIDMGDFGIDLGDGDDDEDGDADVEGEVPFTEELLEEHNYVVLYFDNEVDWLQAKTLLGVKKVAALDSKKGFEKAGVGRVMRGTDAIEAIRKSME